MNEFNILGKALNKPELRESEGGTQYSLLQVAVKKPFKNKDGEYEEDLLQFTLFKNLAQEVSDSVDEGTPVIIKGHISSNNYEKDGRVMFNSSLIADRVSQVSYLC